MWFSLLPCILPFHSVGCYKCCIETFLVFEVPICQVSLMSEKKLKAYSEIPIVHQYRLGYCLWFLPTNLMIQISCRSIWCIWSWLSFIYIWIPRIFFCNSLKILCIFLGLCKTSGWYSEISSCSGLLFSSTGLWIRFCVHTTLVLSLEACNKPYSLEW